MQTFNCMLLRKFYRVINSIMSFVPLTTQTLPTRASDGAILYVNFSTGGNVDYYYFLTSGEFGGSTSFDMQTLIPAGTAPTPTHVEVQPGTRYYKINTGQIVNSNDNPANLSEDVEMDTLVFGYFPTFLNIQNSAPNLTVPLPFQRFRGDYAALSQLVSSAATNIGECYSRCLNNYQACEMWQFNTSNKFCTLFTDASNDNKVTGIKVDTNIRTNSGGSSPILYSLSAPARSPGPNDVLTNIPSQDICETRCNNQLSCNVYTYDINSQTCTMFSSISSPAPLFNMRLGVSKTNAIKLITFTGTQVSGTRTIVFKGTVYSGTPGTEILDIIEFGVSPENIMASGTVSALTSTAGISVNLGNDVPSDSSFGVRVRFRNNPSVVSRVYTFTYTNPEEWIFTQTNTFESLGLTGVSYLQINKPGTVEEPYTIDFFGPSVYYDWTSTLNDNTYIKINCLQFYGVFFIYAVSSPDVNYVPQVIGEFRDYRNLSSTTLNPTYVTCTSSDIFVGTYTAPP